MRQTKERGQALLLMTVAITVLFGMLALVVDVGWAHYKKQAARAAAEAAAMAAAEAALNDLAGGASFSCGGRGLQCQPATPCPANVAAPANNVQVGCMYAAANGFRAGGQNGAQDVVLASSISNSVPTAPGVKVSYWVTATVSQRLPSLFGAVLGNYGLLASARASAAFVSGGNCIYILDPLSPGALSAGGSSSLTARCGVMVNSISSQAMQIGGSACISAPAYQLVGWYSTTAGCPISPTPVRAQFSPDPLASLAAPTYSGCDHTNYSTNSGDTIDPGVYCGGITLNGGTLTMNAGTYILLGGGMRTGGGTIVNGSGVTIYNTGSGRYGYQPIRFNGNTHVTLSAPTSGPLEGILFFHDRTILSASQNTLTGDDTSQFQGTLYFPTAPLQFSGNSSLTAYSIIVAWDLALTGSASINDDYSSLSSGGPLRNVALIE